MTGKSMARVGILAVLLTGVFALRPAAGKGIPELPSIIHMEKEVELAPIPPKDLPAGAKLEVHEWGVVQHDMATGRATTLGDDLPAWVRRAAPVQAAVQGRDVPKKPLLYLYPVGIESAAVRVRIRDGSPLFWWPEAGVSRAAGGGALTWPEVRFPVGEVAASESPAPGHWILAARDVDASWLEAGGARERFLFYEGERPVFQPLALGGTPDAARIRNAGSEAVHGLMLVRREGGKVSFATLGTLAPGDEAVLRPVAATDGSDEPAIRAFRRSLEEAGLFAKEAAGLAGIWREDLFRNEGLTLLYLWDEAAYDRLLPLEVSPAPTRRVRVMVGALAGIDLAYAERVLSLADGLGGAEFEERERASRALSALGAKAAPYLAPATLSADPEIRSRAGTVLAGCAARTAGR